MMKFSHYAGGMGVLFIAVWMAFLIFRSGPEAHEEEIPVWVAARSLTAGTVLEPKHVRRRRIPKAYLAPDAWLVSDPVGASPGDQRMALLPIQEGEPLTRSKFGLLSEANRIARLIPPGDVAVSFEVDPARALAGFIHPGDRVDLFGTFDLSSDGKESSATLSLKQNALVLAVNQRALGSNSSSSPEIPTAILTVALNPVNAQRLIFARERGVIGFALRRIADEQTLDLFPVGTSSFRRDFSTISDITRLLKRAR